MISYSVLYDISYIIFKSNTIYLLGKFCWNVGTSALSSSTFHSRSPLSAYSTFSTVHGSPCFVPGQSSQACCSALFTFLSDQAYHFCFHRLLHGKQSSRHLPPNCCLLMGLLNWNDGVGTMVQDWWCGIDSAGLIVPNY